MKKRIGFTRFVVAAICFFVVTIDIFVLRGQTKSLPDALKPFRSFVVEDEFGRKMDVAFQKNKVIFINFWALTCLPCKVEMPTINNLKSHFLHDTNFMVLPVDLDRNFVQDESYFKQKNFNLNVYKPVGIVPQEIFMGVLPTTVVIARDGNIAFFRDGESVYDSPSFFYFIDSLLK